MPGPAVAVRGRPEPRLVVVEQETVTRADLVGMLTGDGYAVVGQGGDRRRALALATDLRPDLVIVDAAMPAGDGIAAVAAITGARVAPVLVLTGLADRSLVGRIRDAGAMGCLVKPVASASLLPAVEVAIARYADAAALRAQAADIAAKVQTRNVVDRAKALLIAEWGMTESEAFRWLQRTAMNRRASMLAVGTAVIGQLGAAGR